MTKMKRSRYVYDSRSTGAEKKVKEVLEAVKNSGAYYPDELALELQKSTDEYARVVRELK